jgi:hypothetical protein
MIDPFELGMYVYQGNSAHMAGQKGVHKKFCSGSQRYGKNVSKNKRDIGISEESGKVEEEGKNDDVCPANPVHNLLSAIEEWNANNAANCQGHSFEG